MRLTARWSAGRGSSGAAQTGPASRTGGSRVHLELSTKLREVFKVPGGEGFTKASSLLKGQRAFKFKNLF